MNCRPTNSSALLSVMLTFKPKDLLIQQVGKKQESALFWMLNTLPSWKNTTTNINITSQISDIRCYGKQQRAESTSPTFCASLPWKTFIVLELSQGQCYDEAPPSKNKRLPWAHFYIRTAWLSDSVCTLTHWSLFRKSQSAGGASTEFTCQSNSAGAWRHHLITPASCLLFLLSQGSVETDCTVCSQHKLISPLSCTVCSFSVWFPNEIVSLDKRIFSTRR